MKRRNRNIKQVYPKFIFNTNDVAEYPFLVYVPDFDIFSEGDSFAGAIEMARDADALSGWLDYEASKAGINVSRILQEELIHALGLEKMDRK